jgi:hypothetical protein
MIVQHRKRPHALWPVFRSLEVHLPQFVWPIPLEALNLMRTAVRYKVEASKITARVTAESSAKRRYRKANPAIGKNKAN